MALFDAFLKLDGIKGESADAKHKSEIDIMSFSWGVSQITTGSASGAGLGQSSGKAHFQEFTITKKIDASSPLLMLNCANGTVLKDNLMTVRKAGGDQLEYLKVKLTNAVVARVTRHANDFDWIKGGVTDEIPLEQVAFTFQKIEENYQAQGADGKAAGGPILAGWDVSQGKKA
jgi:type VI secretion system secreted protein Hcp